MFVSRRHLLQWTPSHEAERASAASLAEFYRLMWACPVLGCIGVFAAPAGLQLPAVPFFLLWIAGPAIAWRVSRPARVARFVPTDEDTRFLRMLARRTWAFFDRHVGPEDNWLPPDNIQEAPRPAVAHRTSPTNIGLALLAHLAAHDFGYLGAGQLLIRLERMFETMCRLKRHRNHFYNWYDTQSLRPLPPRYISTVDSGNLAGHLLALRSGLLALPDEAAANPRALDGLRDTAAVLDEALENLTASSARNARTLLHKRLDALLPAAFSLSEQTVTALDALVDAARALERMVEHAAGQNDESPSPEHQEVLFWSRTLTAVSGRAGRNRRARAPLRMPARRRGNSAHLASTGGAPPAGAPSGGQGQRKTPRPARQDPRSGAGEAGCRGAPGRSRGRTGAHGFLFPV